MYTAFTNHAQFFRRTHNTVIITMYTLTTVGEYMKFMYE